MKRLKRSSSSWPTPICACGAVGPVGTVAQPARSIVCRRATQRVLSGSSAQRLPFNSGLCREHGSVVEFASQLADSQANLGLLLNQLGDSKGAEQSLRAAIGVLRTQVEADAHNLLAVQSDDQFEQLELCSPRPRRRGC